MLGSLPRSNLGPVRWGWGAGYECDYSSPPRSVEEVRKYERFVVCGADATSDQEHGVSTATFDSPRIGAIEGSAFEMPRGDRTAGRFWRCGQQQRKGLLMLMLIQDAQSIKRAADGSGAHYCSFGTRYYQTALPPLSPRTSRDVFLPGPADVRI